MGPEAGPTASWVLIPALSAWEDVTLLLVDLGLSDTRWFDLRPLGVTY